MATNKGHLDQEHQNLQSTKEKRDATEKEIHEDAFPSGGIGTKTYEYVSVVMPLDPKMKAYLDLTGQFPHKSSRGNEYLYVMYDSDGNTILAQAILNR
eukprot:270517-Ditylum_brightwellii.AAC.1